MYKIKGEPNMRASKIAAFDLDDTLIVPKSGKKFPQSADDWKFLNDKVSTKLAELHKDNYLLMIVTNKLSISVGKMSEGEFETKMEQIYDALKIPFICYYSIKKDEFRKPRTGIWEMFTFSRPDKSIKLDMTNSFYCGDAAGRPTDFSDSDYKFALNIGLSFKLPYQVFGDLTELSVRNLKTPYHPLKGVSRGEYDLSFTYDFTDQNMIVLTGSPASGKSTLTKILSTENEYSVVSQDTLKTPAKCKKMLNKLFNEGLDVVIDNTNATIKNRKVWIDIAKEFSIKTVVSIHLTTPKPIAFHMRTYRELYDVKDEEPPKKHIPDVAIHTYFKRFEQPTLDEGFTKLIEFPFLLSEKNGGTDAETRLMQYLS